jgi:hypothetical protein
MKQIIKEFEVFMSKYGRLHSQFYIGIAATQDA